MKKGIDISENNGSVNMSKFKNIGIEFIILRLGYGKNKSQIDKKFYENYNKERNIKSQLECIYIRMLVIIAML